jgi:hypothetical protein
MLASTKCHALSSNLLSIANETSKEDVELAARHIAACATNVLSVRVQISYEGTARDDSPLLSSDFLHKVDLSEV